MTARRKVGLYVVLAFVVLLVGCNALIAPLVYFAKPFRGRVVDADNGQPIEGAVVVAEWRPSYLLYGDRSTPIEVFETMTDGQGGYSFSGWGPRLRLWTERLDYLDPEVIVFKTGYEPRFESNSRHRNTYIRVSDWDAVTLQLEPFRGTPARRLDQLETLLSEAGIGAGHLDKLFDEMLKEGPLVVRGAKPFFQGIENLKGRGL